MEIKRPEEVTTCVQFDDDGGRYYSLDCSSDGAVSVEDGCGALGFMHFGSVESFREDIVKFFMDGCDGVPRPEVSIERAVELVEYILAVFSLGESRRRRALEVLDESQRLGSIFGMSATIAYEKTLAELEASDAQ